MSSAEATPARPAGRQIRLGLMIFFIAGVFVQFYLAGRGVFGASNYNAHKDWGNVLHIISLIILIATIAIPASRTARDIQMAVSLFVLVTIQVIIGDLKHHEVGAFHPVVALLIVGLSFGMLERDREFMRGPG
jgi:uncharacterized membrane protein YhaH (DUF805 family)